MNDSKISWTERPSAIFWMVTGVALLLRWVHIWQMSDPALNPSFLEPVTDAGVHHRWAQQILTGAWPGPEPFFRAPLYPYFLAGMYKIFGGSNPLGVQLAHGVISAAGAGLAALCSLKLWDTRTAWFSGLLFAGLWSSIYFSGELLGTTLGVTLNLLLLYLVLTSASKRHIFLCGLVLGISAITRPTVLVITPAILWFMWQRGSLRSSWLVFGLGLVVSIGPVTLRNLSQGGEPVLIAASGGVNFYIGNNEHADGRIAFLPGAPMTWQGEMSDVVALASEEEGRPLTAQASDRHFWRKGWQYWQQEPRDALGLLARKGWLLAANGERSNNKNLAFWRERSALLRWPIWPGWGLILGLAVLGFFRPDLQKSNRWLLIGSIGLYCAALLLFFINARFRLPVLAWLVIPAGGGLSVLYLWFRTRARDQLPRLAIPLALGVMLLSVVPDALTYHQDPATDFESWRSLGNSYLSVSDEALAIQAWETALAIDKMAPQSAHRWTLPQIYQPMVQLHQRQGRSESALSVQRRWVQRLPQSTHARLGLANILLQMNRVAEAIEQLDIVVSETPENIEARLGLGWACYQNNQFNQAITQFEMIATGPHATNAEYGISLSLFALDKFPEAESRLKRLVSGAPDFWQAYENLALLYEKTGRPADEMRSWSKVLAYRPQHKKARERMAALR
ncbi:MAG: Tfp pilus assembly protein PilF [Candidatus Krumholzibacteriia bacterium]|jgi:Tfp pilus assembly protein PilF